MSADAYDEALRLRIEDDGYGDDLGRQEDPVAAGSVSIVAKTTTVSVYPTSAAVFYGVVPQTVFGTESEGGSGSVGAGTGTFYALNLGGSIPPTGTAVIVTFAGNRWTFRYDAT